MVALGVLRVVAVVLSLVVLGAHFLRAGIPMAVIIGGLVVSLALLVVRRPWASRVVQIVLVLGALEWARTAIVLAGGRAGLGEPYGRMLLILGGVAIFTMLSALCLRPGRYRAIASDEAR